jgi:uncharacterized protein YchJ
MAGPIAFCENPSCGAVFQFNQLIGGPGKTNIEFINSKVGPCPACGDMGSIPDGTYEYANGVLNILSSSKISVTELQKVEKILRSARRSKIKSDDEIIGEVKKASPAVADAFQLVPKQNNVIQWLTLLIAFVALAIQIHSTYFKETDQSVEKKVIEYLLKEFGAASESNIAPDKNSPYRREGPKIQRNDPCPCGSGKKYKKCCGNPLTAV